MIPHLGRPQIDVGPLTIHGFGLLVAVAILVGIEVLRRRAIRKSLDPALAQRFVAWTLVGGFVGAHLVDRFVYFPAETWRDPWSIVRIWAGLSSFGGFLGALCGMWLFLRTHRLGGLSWFYVDLVAYAFPFGWVFGRLGCFLAFDHPGAPTRFLLGQQDADGVVRHNLGLEEALYTVLIAAVFARLGRSKQHPGFFTGMLALLYAPFRFALDFLRQVDVRYLGLTPGQYGAAVVLACGVAILAASQRARFGVAH